MNYYCVCLSRPRVSTPGVSPGDAWAERRSGRGASVIVRVLESPLPSSEWDCSIYKESPAPSLRSSFPLL